MNVRTLLAAILFAAAAGCVSHPPTIAHVHIGHAVTGVHVTPGQKGYFQQAEERAREAAEKARTASESEDLAEIKSTAATIITATESKEQFGLKHALVMAANHLTFAATSPDASINLQQSAPGFAKDITRVVERCELITLLGKDVEASATVPEATVLTTEIRKLAAANLDGEDTDGDGKVGGTAAEYRDRPVAVPARCHRGARESAVPHRRPVVSVQPRQVAERPLGVRQARPRR